MNAGSRDRLCSWHRFIPAKEPVPARQNFAVEKIGAVFSARTGNRKHCDNF